MHKSIEEEVEQFIEDLTLSYPLRNTVILVEDREDMAFWKHIFEEYAPTVKPDFPFLSSSGKSELKKYIEFVSDEFIICVDSDNDSFYKTNNTEWINKKKPFVFQTHTHSRENYFAFAQNLQRLAESFEFEYDFDSDFKQISEILYEWLINWLFFNDLERHWLRKEIQNFATEISWEKLKTIIADSYKKVDLKSVNTLDKLRNVTTFLKESIIEYKTYLDNLMLDNGYDYLLAERNEFRDSCSIEPQETLHFVQGHITFDDIILPYFTKVIQILASNMADKQTTKEKRNHYVGRGEKDDYTDSLKASYIFCFSSSTKSKYMELIKRDIISDFPA